MSELIRKIALECHILNCDELKTPGHYIIPGNAEEKDLLNFADAIIQECCTIIINRGWQRRSFGQNLTALSSTEITAIIKAHFYLEYVF